MGNEKSHALPFVLHHRCTVYLPWVYDSIYLYLWSTYAMIILIEWHTRSWSGILRTFLTYIGETVIWRFIIYEHYVLNFVPWLLSSSPLARLNTNCFLFSKSSWIMSPVLNNCVIYLAPLVWALTQIFHITQQILPAERS